MKPIVRLRNLLELHGIYNQAVKLLRQHIREAAEMINQGDTIEISKDGRTIRGVVQQAFGGEGNWDIHYNILNPRPGRGSIGRWKQAADGGDVTVLQSGS